MSDIKINSSRCTQENSRDIDLPDSIPRISFSIFWASCMRAFSKIWKKLIGSRCHKNVRSSLIDENLEGIFSDTEKKIFNNILRFREIRICDIMVPRINIDAVEDKATIRKVMLMFEKYGRSWMPVYKDSLDNPRGMIRMHDLVSCIAHTNNINLDMNLSESNLIKDILFIPSSMLVSELLRKIQESRVHIALVIDEYGGTEGLVSYGDIVSVLIGDVTSERNGKPMISAISDNTFIVDARTDLEELAKIIGADCNFLKGEQDVDSLGGLIFSVLDRIPSKGEVILEIPGFEIVILEADVRCVRIVRIRRLFHFKN
ncbi:transporter associated domain-containing protein [Candidatus Liberibacter brunswickensis]|uniref:transporter associated domain-containing protein n=1 Tax=Candidatus Liberibacter brunswickensis TaxID=1968796 RepID=UPI002FE3B3B8